MRRALQQRDRATAIRVKTAAKRRLGRHKLAREHQAGFRFQLRLTEAVRDFGVVRLRAPNARWRAVANQLLAQAGYAKAYPPKRTR